MPSAPRGGTLAGMSKRRDKAAYEAELLRLQAELVDMQEWVRATG